MAAVKNSPDDLEAAVAPAAAKGVAWPATAKGSVPTLAAVAGAPPALMALAQLLGRQAARQALQQRRGCSLADIIWILLAIAAALATATQYHGIRHAVTKLL